MRSKSFTIPSLLALFFCVACAGLVVHPFLNLGFEKSVGNNIPDKWYVGSGGISNGTAFHGTMDNAEKHSGTYSLRLQCDGPPQSGEFGVCTNVFELPKGTQTVHISAWVKTKDAESAKIWANDGATGFSHYFADSGTNNWKQYSFDLELSSGAKFVNFGGVLDGHGTAWFDDFEVAVNGKRWTDKQ